MKFVFRTLFVLVLAGVLAVGVLGGMAYISNKPPADSDSIAVFTVYKGESVRNVARRLKEGNLIKAELFLRAYAKLKRTEASFLAGSYRIEAGSTGAQIHNILVSGREILQKVTVPEGWPSSRIGELLEEHEIISKDDFMEAMHDPDLLGELGVSAGNAEGFLYPDTYHMPKGYPAEKVVAHMVNRFFQVFAEISSGKQPHDFPELYNIVILASIIEREYVVPDEAPKMASVFYNRLARDMKLQSCATVAYVLTEELGYEHPDYLTLRDLEVESDYNTYLYAGIPPGPIGNPGRTALEAAIYPAQTEFLFFVLKNQSSGEHEFTRSYDQHLDAKSLFLKKS
ncbi:MAG: aminodeoxychorismate lyase [Spirochaetales bacterium]|nr:aminodeoxychorismate lyase [Spirochaetales bacterium]